MAPSSIYKSFHMANTSSHNRLRTAQDHTWVITNQLDNVLVSYEQPRTSSVRGPDHVKKALEISRHVPQRNCLNHCCLTHHRLVSPATPIIFGTNATFLFIRESGQNYQHMNKKKNTQLHQFLVGAAGATIVLSPIPVRFFFFSTSWSIDRIDLFYKLIDGLTKCP